AGQPPVRLATQLAKLALLPLLVAQGRHVRATALKLPEAAGERHGVAGSGRVALRVLIVGDSSAAGVGVGTQDEAFAGQLAQALVRHLQGQTGRLHLPLPEAPRAPGRDDATPEGWMAHDGFHPGLLGYRQWGRQVAAALG